MEIVSDVIEESVESKSDGQSERETTKIMMNPMKTQL